MNKIAANYSTAQTRRTGKGSPHLARRQIAERVGQFYEFSDRQRFGPTTAVRLAPGQGAADERPVRNQGEERVGQRLPPAGEDRSDHGLEGLTVGWLGVIRVKAEPDHGRIDL